MDRNAVSPRRILLIGYGAIAAELSEALRQRGHMVTTLLRAGSRSRERVPEGVMIAATLDEAASFAPELVVEAAGHEAVREIVPDCLSRGLPVLISSIGALHDDLLFERLAGLAGSHGGRLLLASGALGALDYIRAARAAGGLSVAYESRKPPAAWAAELRALGHDPEALASPVTLFEGTAREAAAAYPQNLNVAAALALAGPGFEATRVAVVCDPDATGNTHSVRAQSEYGTMAITIANRPSPTNPKSSWIVSRSLLAAVEQYFSPVVML